MKKYILSLMAMTVLGTTTMFAQNDIITLEPDNNRSERTISMSALTRSSEAQTQTQAQQYAETRSSRDYEYDRDARYDRDYDRRDRDYDNGYGYDRSTRRDRDYDRGVRYERRPAEVVVVHDRAPRHHRVVRHVPVPVPVPAPVVVGPCTSRVGAGMVVGAVIGGIIAAATR